MNKKLFGTLLLGSLLMGGTFVSCKDYDDDIDNLQKQIESHATAISQLQSAVASLSYVTNVAKNGDGIDVTFSNGTTTTIKTIKGENGQDGSVVTIGENGNWAIDGKDTGVPAKGEAGKSPVIGEDGCWAVYNAETKEYESTGVLAAAAGTVAESSDGLAYEITLKNADGENVIVKVPAVAVITNVAAYSFNTESFDWNGDLRNPAWVSKITGQSTLHVYYGIVAADVTFNGKTYKKGATISGRGSMICAETSPLQVDATAYQWELSDSKSGSIVEIANVQEFKTVNALTRGATANPGFYLFSVKLKDGIGNKEIGGDSIKYTDWGGNDASSVKVYALKTKDYQGNIISSDYCYKIAPAKVKDITIYANNTVTVVNKAFDMFANALDGTYKEVDHYNGTEWGPYWSSSANLIADCTFEFPQDQTAKKEALGASINGNTITAANPGTITVKAKYLTIEGKKGEKTFQVTFQTAATTSSISDFNWSVQADNANTPAVDETVVSNVVTGLDKYLSSANYVSEGTDIGANGVKVQELTLSNAAITFKYNPALDGNPAVTGITPTLYKITDQNGYVSYKMNLKFNPSTVRPNPVVGTLKFDRIDDNYPQMTVTFNVNVTDAQTFDFKPKAAYFSGTEATAYGIANGTNIASNIFDFFEIAATDVPNIVIKEIVPQYTDNNGDAQDVAAWTGATKNAQGNYMIGTVGTTTLAEGALSVKKWNANGTDGDPNKGNYGAYSDASRKFVIYYYPNGNTSVNPISYEFGVTIKSIVAEGTMKYVKPTITYDNGGNITNVTYADGETVEVVGADAPTIDLIKNFSCKDANNAEFHLVAGTDNWGATVTTWPKNTATTLQTNYATVLGTEVEDALKPYVTATVAGGKIKFERVDNTVVIVNPVSGKVALTVTDNWGRTTKVEVPVTVK